MPPKKRRGPKKRRAPDDDHIEPIEPTKTAKCEVPDYKFSAWGQHIIDRNQRVDSSACMCSEGTCAVGALYDRCTGKCAISVAPDKDPVYYYAALCPHEPFVVVRYRPRNIRRRFIIPALAPVPDDAETRFTPGELLANGYYSSKDEWKEACREYAPFDAVPIDLLKLILSYFNTHRYWCCGTQWATLSLVCSLWYYVVNGRDIKVNSRDTGCILPPIRSFASAIVADINTSMGDHRAPSSFAFWYVNRRRPDNKYSRVRHHPFTRAQVADVYLALLPWIVEQEFTDLAKNYESYLNILSRVDPLLQSEILEKTPQSFLSALGLTNMLVFNYAPMLESYEGYLRVYKLLISLPCVQTSILDNTSDDFCIIMQCHNGKNTESTQCANLTDIARILLQSGDWIRQTQYLATVARYMVDHLCDPSEVIELFIDSNMLDFNERYSCYRDMCLWEYITIDINKFSEEFIIKHAAKISVEVVNDLILGDDIRMPVFETLVRAKVINPTADMFMEFVRGDEMMNFIFNSLTEKEKRRIAAKGHTK